MTRIEATTMARELLNKYNLQHWGVRLTTDIYKGFLGMCDHKAECIILSAQHIDIHDTASVKNTIRHEVAHALTPGHSHDITWQMKARELGCDNTFPCSNLSFTPEIIDAIRSGATLEIEIEEQVIRTPRYTITRLQEKCPTCHKVAIEKRTLESPTLGKIFITLECGHVITKTLIKSTPFDQFISDDADPNCKHEWDKTFCQKCDAKRPFDFQVEGMRAVERGLVLSKGFAIFDEMGLGKTIQAFGYLKYHPEAFPVCWVLKSGIMHQTFQQSLTWLGLDLMPQILNQSGTPVLPKFKQYMVSYDLLVPKVRTNKKTGKIITQGFNVQKLIDRGIKTVILDECQLIKNADSGRTQEVRKLCTSADNVIPLSGTPWKNRGSEFFTVLNIIAPQKFNSFERFKNNWVEFFWDGNKYKEAGIRNIPAFKEYVKDICIRREFNDVMTEYPEVMRTMQYTEIDFVNQQLYDEEVSEFVKWWNQRIVGGEDPNQFGSDNIIAKLTHMRHILGLAKLKPTIEYVEDFIEENQRKLVIFVHHIDVGQILLDTLKKKFDGKFPVLALKGGMGPRERYEVQEEFNRAPLAILVASTLAAGEGINLQTCSDAILMESQWNPQNEDQAAPGRFKRIGQLANHVNVIFITGRDTIDDFFRGIVERKRKWFHAAHNKGDVPTWDVKSIMTELAEAIVNNYNQKKKVS